MNKNILEIKNLTKYYGSILGVKNINLEIKKGEVFGFIGPNGAGKSTTIRSIMNLINKNEGIILFDGNELNKDNVILKKNIGYLPSEIHLYEDLTVKEMFDYHESFYNNIHNNRCDLSKLFDIDESKKIEDLSLGNLKKVGIVLAFMHNPKLIILDEPTSGLDPIMQQKFYDLVLKTKKSGTTIFYSTHILNEVYKICDKVGIIKNGELIKVETIEEIHKKSFTNVLIESNYINELIKELKLNHYSIHKNVIKFKNSLEINKLIKIISKYKVDKLLIENATLEDLFLHYYK